MLTPLIQNIKLSNFRLIKHLHISTLSKVNLITGKNNTGKSTLLEGIKILTNNNPIQITKNLLLSRDQIATNTTTKDTENLDLSDFISPIFHNFPDPFNNSQDCQFSISSESFDNAYKALSLSMQFGWLLDAPEGTLDVPPSAALRYETRTGQQTPAEITSVPLNTLNKILNEERFYHSKFKDRLTKDYACIFVDPLSSQTLSSTSNLWDKIALTDKEKNVVRALKIVSPHIEAVSMVNDSRGGRHPIVRSSQFKNPVKLSTYGDGTRRIFNLILALSCAEDGILLIDEFENGLHHSAMLDTWRLFFTLAHELDVQIFATTHSWDCVRAFQQAASETAEDDALLIRLSKYEESVIPTLFSERELAIVTEDHIEVR